MIDLSSTAYQQLAAIGMPKIIVQMWECLLLHIFLMIQLLLFKHYLGGEEGDSHISLVYLYVCEYMGHTGIGTRSPIKIPNHYALHQHHIQ